MQLRNGKIVSNYVTHSYTTVMDDKDYIPQVTWSELYYNWIEGLKVYKRDKPLSEWQYVYDYMKYNAKNAQAWCRQEPFVKRYKDASDFLVTIYNMCEHFSRQARTLLDRPTTRQQQQFLEKNNGFLRGILRLGTEIRLHWTLAQGHVTA
jgi:hypothetical protein